MAWKKGQSGNPGGRSSARVKLTNKYLRQLMHDFDEHGPKVIEKVRENDPSTYMRIIASFVPKDFAVTNTHEFDFSGLTDAELDAAERIFAVIANKATEGSESEQEQPDRVHTSH